MCCTVTRKGREGPCLRFICLRLHATIAGDETHTCAAPAQATRSADIEHLLVQQDFCQPKIREFGRKAQRAQRISLQQHVVLRVHSGVRGSWTAACVYLLRSWSPGRCGWPCHGECCVELPMQVRVCRTSLTSPCRRRNLCMYCKPVPMSSSTCFKGLSHLTRNVVAWIARNACGDASHARMLRGSQARDLARTQTPAHVPRALSKPCICAQGVLRSHPRC